MAEAETGQTSIYLNTDDRAVLEALQERTGLGRSAVVRLALHRVAQEEGDAAQVDRLAAIRAAAEEILSLTQT
jgi:hypothetical protein